MTAKAPIRITKLIIFVISVIGVIFLAIGVKSNLDQIHAREADLDKVKEEWASLVIEYAAGPSEYRKVPIPQSAYDCVKAQARPDLTLNEKDQLGTKCIEKATGLSIYEVRGLT